MTESIVIAPHPDDEVLGCASVLRESATTVIHLSDGVPPWTPDDDATALRQRRHRECEAAWDTLGARVKDVAEIGLRDLSVWRSVPALTVALCDLLGKLKSATVHVPAYQRGHPDHDAAYVAALRVRSELTHCGLSWRVYSLYGYGPDERLHFDHLDRRSFPDVEVLGEGPEELDRKAAALMCFVSQLRPDSIVQRWLDRPQPESLATMPAAAIVTPGVSFYERELDFARYGARVEEVDSLLERLLPGRAPLG
ncbi:MAG: PIG-L deacetylase family protein [Acidimicrobiales bacterium]